MTGMKIRIALLTVVMTFLACSAFAAIANTKHDLSFFTTAWSGSPSYQTNEAQICVFCHTPHGGNLTGPLWNKPVPAAGGFTMYRSSDALKTELNSVTTVNNESLLCLSCHDGSIGVNNLLNFGSAGSGQPVVIDQGPGEVFMPGSPGANPRIGGGAGGDPNSTGHLADDHPISLNYDNAVGDNPTGLHTLADAKTAGVVFFPPSGAGNRLECSSCHDVHDNTIQPFLIKDNSGSALCLSCHIK
jgi:predicted CXXCH cytochrome family protein